MLPVAIYIVFQGHASIWTAFAGFFMPVALGNTIGGILLVALLNYGQTEDRRFPDRDPRQFELSWSEWLYGRHTGRPSTQSFVEELSRE
jgi:hypothetical protein